MDNITYNTKQTYIKDRSIFKPSKNTPGGGVVSKAMNIMEAMPTIRVVGGTEKMGRIAIIDPLVMHTPNWAENITNIMNNDDKIKGIFFEEQEFMRWSKDRQNALLEKCNFFWCCNKYQKQILNFYNINASIVYTPINTELFNPVSPKKRQVIITSKIGIQKNSEFIIELFKRMPKDIRKVYIGNCELWGGHAFAPIDYHLEKQIKRIADEYISSCTQSELAQWVNASMFYVGAMHYATGELGFLEAACAGCHCLTWKYHPMFDEYQNTYPFWTVSDCIDIMESIKTDKPNIKIREEMIKKHSYEAFNTNVRNQILEIILNGKVID